MVKKFIVPVLSIGVIAGCSKSSDSAATSATLNSPSSIMNAVGSMGSNGLSASGLHTMTENASDDTRCGEHGSPYLSGSPMSNSSADYAPTHFYCLLSANLGSPETVRGSLKQLKSVFCSVEAAIGTITCTEAGNDMVDSEKTVPLTSACWPQGMPDGMTSVTITDLVATKLDSATTGWATFNADAKPLCDDGNAVTLDSIPVTGVLGACE